MITYETNRRLYVAARAQVVDEGSMKAWAERHVRVDRDIKWILGNFVEADNANDNGHIFPLPDLEKMHSTIAGKPLNMLHHANYIVGAFAGSELAYPTEEHAGSVVMEALSGFWRSFFPDEYELVEKANADGSLFYSMECMPATVTCPVVECSLTAAYAGKVSDTYCAHMNGIVAPKRLDMPHFNAGAVIVPPVRPGWRRANVTELSQLLRETVDEAEKLYDQIEQEFPHLDAAQWEEMMLLVVEQAAVRDQP